MANINLVNLNDAVHRLLNPAWPWLGDSSLTDLSCFNATNCPRLHQRDRKEVPTWKDFVTILSGNENIADTYASGRKTRCLALSEYSSYTALYKPWGRTFGKHTGPNGQPLSEVKPLDEMFWFYDSFVRKFKEYPGEYAGNECKLASFYYNSTNGWYHNWAQAGWNAPNSSAYNTLEPGVYGVISNAYNAGNVYWVIVDDTGPTLPGQEQILTRAYAGADVWKHMNAIFFVDSPVRIKAAWSNSTYMMGSLWKITPPGYWVP